MTHQQAKNLRSVVAVLALSTLGATAWAQAPAPTKAPAKAKAKVSPAQKAFDDMIQASFRDQGIATVDRLKQDESNAECSKAGTKPLPAKKAAAIEKANLATIKPPSDGQYLGDWKTGERIAQNGRGMTWTDKSAETSANGGNCYNCHQISKQEISFGTIGPSLYQYGKLRGVADPASPESKAIVEYTWGKLNNPRAYSACSNMPRFGHNGLLDEGQLKHLMALLLDPKSPVNAAE